MPKAPGVVRATSKGQRDERAQPSIQVRRLPYKYLKVRAGYSISWMMRPLPIAYAGTTW